MLSSNQSLAISCVIPTYQGYHLLKENLPNVIATLKNNDQLIIIDDHGQDETIAKLLHDWDISASAKVTQEINEVPIYKWQKQIHIDSKRVEVCLLQSTRNLRFAGAVNAAVSQVQYDYFLLFNNDVSPDPNCRNELLKYFLYPQTLSSQTTQPDLVFGVGCLEVQTSGKIPHYSGKNVLSFQRGLFIHNQAPDLETGSTAWVSGGSGMFSKAKWNELGGFDVAFYPAYWEDIDLSYRARQKDWLVLFAAEARVTHNHESTNQDTFGQQLIKTMSWRNAQVFARKHATSWQKLAYILWKPYWWLKMK